MNIVSVYQKFPTQDYCIKHLESVRWSKGAVCVYCKSTKVTPVPSESRHHCNNCNTSFSVTVGTIFHHTHLPIQKWFLAVSLILNAKKGISSRQLSRDLDVHRNTAWRISMQIRKAMREAEQRDLLTGIVEMDETFIGGKPRKGDPENIHLRGMGTKKTPVVGMVERGGKIKAKVIKKSDLTNQKLSMIVRRNIDTSNAVLVTDEWPGYSRIKYFMAHETINHSETYVSGDIHTNNIESFWALLKRGLIGQFHKVSLKHLHRYIDEFCYRHNQRKNPFVFDLTISKGLGVSL